MADRWVPVSANEVNSVKLVNVTGTQHDFRHNACLKLEASTGDWSSSPVSLKR